MKPKIPLEEAIAARSPLRLAVAPLRNIDVRDASGTGDGSWTVEGYSAVYEQETVLYDIPGWVRVREEIGRGAFTNVLERLSHGDGLIHLNHGHDMKTAVAASDVSGIGELELAEDFHGQRFFARIDIEDPDAKSMAVKMRRKVVRQSSFAFTIGDEEIIEENVLDDGTWDLKFRINEIADQFDVCVCAQGAYPQTESFLRSLAAASLRIPNLGVSGRSQELDDLLEGLQRRRASARGASDVAPAPVGGSESSRALADLRAHVKTTSSTRFAGEHLQERTAA
jgi:HK97 family phage prohead protease